MDLATEIHTELSRPSARGGEEEVESNDNQNRNQEAEGEVCTTSSPNNRWSAPVYDITALSASSPVTNTSPLEQPRPHSAYIQQHFVAQVPVDSNASSGHSGSGTPTAERKSDQLRRQYFEEESQSTPYRDEESANIFHTGNEPVLMQSTSMNHNRGQHHDGYTHGSLLSTSSGGSSLVPHKMPAVSEYHDKPRSSTPQHALSNGAKEVHDDDDNEDDDDILVVNRTVDEEDDDASVGFYDPAKIDEYGFIVGESSLRLVNRSVLRRREMKWLEMLKNWRFYMNRRYDKVRDRCRKGIPTAIRARAWLYLSGGEYHKKHPSSRDLFKQLDANPGDEFWIDQINKDLSRQFPNHELFSRQGPYGRMGRSELFRLLKAYTVLYPDRNQGYCQGQAPVAATLLMHMPLEDAFFCFLQICTKYLPGYYDHGLAAVQLDGDILELVLKNKSRVSYNHLKKLSISPPLYMIEWFMCLFCRTLPWPTVLRVWDMFFCEGVKVLFKVATVLFRYGLGTNEQLKVYGDMYAAMTRLKDLPPEILEEEFLVGKVVELSLDEADLERYHVQVLNQRKKQRQKEQKQREKEQKKREKEEKRLSRHGGRSSVR